MRGSWLVCNATCWMLTLNCVLPAIVLGQSEPLVRLVSGESCAGQLTDLDERGNATFSVDNQAREIAESEIVYWGAYADTDREPQVLLTDGTVLVGQFTRIDGDILVISSELWRELELPRNAVCGILFQPAAAALERDRQVERIRQSPASLDRARLENGDELMGRLETAGVEESENLLFALDKSAQRITLRPENLELLTFAREEGTPATEILGYLGFRDGSLFAYHALRRPDEETIEVETPTGIVVRIALETWRDEVCFYQPLSESVIYVSELPSLGYKHIPFLEAEWPLGIDRNVLGGRLRSASGMALKGIGMHSTARVAFELNGGYRRFDAELALDEQAGFGGSVAYRVLVESAAGDADSSAWKVAYTSPVIRGGEPCVPISVDVSGASRMALIVDFADRGDVLDHANWLNARLVR